MEVSFVLVPINLLPQEQSCKAPSTTNWTKFRKLLSYCLFPETLLVFSAGLSAPCLFALLSGWSS